MNSGSVQIGFDLTYPDAGQMVMKDSDTKGQSLSINATMSDGNFQITSVTGAYASLYSSILLNKTFKPYAEVNRDFEEGTADKTAVTKEWTCKKYSSGSWVDVAAPSMYYKAANGGKVANCYAGKKTDYIYYYTPDKMIGPVNHFEIDLAAYWKANDTINVKISLIDGSGNATYVVGNGDTAKDNGVKQVDIVSCNYSDSIYLEKLTVVGYSSSDIMLIPNSLFSSLNFPIVMQEMNSDIKNKCNMEGASFYQVGAKDYGVKVSSNLPIYTYLDYDSTKEYYAFLNGSSFNIGGYSTKNPKTENAFKALSVILGN